MYNEKELSNKTDVFQSFYFIRSFNDQDTLQIKMLEKFGFFAVVFRIFFIFFTILFVVLVVIKLNIVENNWNNIPLIYNTIYLFYIIFFEQLVYILA